MSHVAEKNVWSWWSDALAGKIGPIHDGQPEWGFYRVREGKNGPWLPVAIWQDENGAFVATRNGAEVKHPEDIWTWCCRHAVTEEAFDAATAGNGWADDAPTNTLAPKDHNQPSDPFEALTEEFAGEKEMAATFLKTKITTQDQADRAAVWSKRLAGIAKKATDLHKVAKQPSLDEGRRIDDKWRDLKEAPAELSKKLKRHMDDFLLEQQRIENERQRKAQEEADRKRREAEDARIAAEKESAKKIADGISDMAAIAEHNNRMAEAERLSQQADDAERDTQTKNATAGRTGAKVALRTFVSARVTDYQAAATALVLMNHPDLLALIDQLANRAIRADKSLPGVERIEEQRAA
ncbi:hypothetical protein G6L15_08355 [Agrobacterium rhizogenes]|uniref:hypothetical protein n=1 Tax=Rhizobium rhizogenes TaxID=359 RepID=UPI00157429B6|nr:hypothetical protein [Rhizobium rhizogenes]NTG86156.1 hypothetical protein [Rhizobium rhizogenes]